MLQGFRRFRAWDDEDILLAAGVKGPLIGPYGPPRERIMAVSKSEAGELLALKRLAKSHGKAAAMKVLLASPEERAEILAREVAPSSRYVEESAIDLLTTTQRRGRKAGKVPEYLQRERTRARELLSPWSTPEADLPEIDLLEEEDEETEGPVPTSLTPEQQAVFRCVKRKVAKRTARGVDWTTAMHKAKKECTASADEKLERCVKKVRKSQVRAGLSPDAATASARDWCVKLQSKQLFSGRHRMKRRTTNKQKARSACLKAKLKSFRRKGMSHKKAFGKASKACAAKKK